MKEEDANATAAVEAPSAAAELDESKAENAGDDKATTEEITETTPEADSAAKPKKEKVKKKWSFRSLSFGRKDKQKKDRKNEENKAVAEGAEGAEEATEDKPTDEKAQEPESTIVESKTLEPVVETVKEEESQSDKFVATASALEPVQAEPVHTKEKTPEPIVAPIVEEKVESVVEKKPTPVEVTEVSAPVEENPAEITEPIEEKPVEIQEPVVQHTFEEPPAIPATPPPSQCSVFVESMNILMAAEDALPVPAEVEDVKEETETNGETRGIDVEPVVEMIEKVLEEAVDVVEAEIADKTANDELPPPPADELIETPQATEVIVEVKQNGVGEHIDEPVKVSGLHLFPIT